jgi:2-oxo-4-hydroxy-4-carboxy--5-ureidoimidazoline (OHCU) decarboxylase
VYDERIAQADLDDLESLLSTRIELAERDDVLPFLRNHPHLCVLIGTYKRQSTLPE